MNHELLWTHGTATVNIIRYGATPWTYDDSGVGAWSTESGSWKGSYDPATKVFTLKTAQGTLVLENKKIPPNLQPVDEKYSLVL